MVSSTYMSFIGVRLSIQLCSPGYFIFKFEV